MFNGFTNIINEATHTKLNCKPMLNKAPGSQIRIIIVAHKSEFPADFFLCNKKAHTRKVVIRQALKVEGGKPVSKAKTQRQIMVKK